MHNGSTMLLILLLADPHLVEGAQTCQDRPTKPRGMSPLDGISRRMDLDALSRCLIAQLVAQPVYHSGEKGASANADDVAQQRRTAVHVDGADGLGHELLYGAHRRGRVLREDTIDAVPEGGLEHDFGGAEALDAEEVVVAIGELVWSRRPAQRLSAGGRNEVVE